MCSTSLRLTLVHSCAQLCTAVYSGGHRVYPEGTSHMSWGGATEFSTYPTPDSLSEIIADYASSTYYTQKYHYSTNKEISMGEGISDGGLDGNGGFNNNSGKSPSL